jgi:hypothetical protein
VPESAAVNVSGAPSAYVPPSRLTTMSPRMDGASSRTFFRACAIEQGERSVHVPPPLGETCSVVTRAAEAGLTTSVNATSAPARAALNDLDTIVALCPSGGTRDRDDQISDMKLLLPTAAPDARQWPGGLVTALAI